MLLRGVEPGAFAPVVCNPAVGLTILSENVCAGCAHNEHILENLVLYAPHVYFLQEARLSEGGLRGLQVRARALGYLVHLDVAHNLLASWSRGLNLAPIAAPDGAAHVRACH